MKYRPSSNYQHGSGAGTGVLLSNLGTPDDHSAASVRRYLAEFLSDPRVIEVPKIIWKPILHGFILRTRPQRSASAYRKIWPDGADSPLRRHLLDQAKLLQRKLNETGYGEPVWVEPGMRYGNPGIRQALRKLSDYGAQRLLALPLYPQYSATTTASTFDMISDELQGWRWLPELRLINCYHDFGPYITAVADSISGFRQGHGAADKLLFSFHGLPQHYFMAGDPYHCACHKTARMVAQALGLEDSQWATSFQSRLGPRAWLKPYTDKLLEEWAKAGVRKVQVVCPGFSADCLETLEEVSIGYKELFQEHGGEELQYIPALNSDPAHIDMMAELVKAHTQGWAAADSEGQRAESRQRAIKMGAAR